MPFNIQARMPYAFAPNAQGSVPVNLSPNTQGVYDAYLGGPGGGRQNFKIVRGPDGGYFKIPPQFNSYEEALISASGGAGAADAPTPMEGQIIQDASGRAYISNPQASRPYGQSGINYQLDPSMAPGAIPPQPVSPPEVPPEVPPIPTRTPSTILGGGEGFIPEGVRAGDYVPAHNLAFPPAPPNFFRDPYGISGTRTPTGIPGVAAPGAIPQNAAGQDIPYRTDTPFMRTDQGLPGLGQRGRISPTPRGKTGIGFIDWFTDQTGLTDYAGEAERKGQSEYNEAAKQAQLGGAEKARGAFLGGQSDAARVLQEGLQESGRIENYLANLGIGRQEQGLREGLGQSSELYQQARSDVQPYRAAEQQALSAMPALQSALGVGPGGAAAIQQALENDPAFQYRQKAAESDIARMLRARGLNLSETGTKMSSEATDRIRAEAADAYRQRLANMAQMGLANAGLAGREAMAQGRDVLGAQLQGGQNIGQAQATLGSNLANRMGQWSTGMGDLMSQTGTGLAQSYTGQGAIEAQSKLNQAQIDASKQPGNVLETIAKLYSAGIIKR